MLGHQMRRHRLQHGRIGLAGLAHRELLDVPSRNRDTCMISVQASREITDGTEAVEHTAMGLRQRSHE